jgi:hypothetical protein
VSDVFPDFAGPQDEKRENIVHLDPMLGIEEVRLRWEAARMVELFSPGAA